MASPSMTYNATGNVAAATALAASATSSAFTIDAHTAFELRLFVRILAGAAVAAGATVTVSVFEGFGTGPSYATVATLPPSYTTPAATLTQDNVPIYLGPGKYQIKLTNNDASNGVTFTLTSVTVDAVA